MTTGRRNMSKETEELTKLLESLLTDGGEALEEEYLGCYGTGLSKEEIRKRREDPTYRPKESTKFYV